MTSELALHDRSQERDLVDPAVFVGRLLGRDRLERDDDLEHGEFGLLDPLTGKRIRVAVQALTRYAARQLDMLHPPSSLS
ncbi:MAG: hypothetical protein KF774_05745 [Planctomyces sp.]|nr:hypothetical protein [Planctomyces sp.]